MESLCVYEFKFVFLFREKINVLSNKKAVHVQFICSLMITDSMNQWINVYMDTESIECQYEATSLPLQKSGSSKEKEQQFRS